VGPGFPPLGERLQVLPGGLSPALVHLVVRFGTQLPFAKAAELLTAACGTVVPHDTVRRLTERAGAVWRQLELDLASRLATVVVSSKACDIDIPEIDPVAAEHDVLLSLDGAMVPLVGGEWAEVRTLVVGSLTPTPHGPTATGLSYASRLTSAAEFGMSVYGELVRRRVPAHPEVVVAVSDGALWIQELLDLHCPGSVRVLDLMHALEYLASAARAVFGPGTQATSDWLAERRTELKAGKRDQVLAQVAELPTSDAQTDALRYLTARPEMLAYDQFIAAGWPIGSGVVESANKLVVEARLKGAGMHWRREHADAVVGLRALDASTRWEAAWPRIVALWRATPRRRRRSQPEAPAIPPPVAEPVNPPARLIPVESLPIPLPTSRPKTIVNGNPTKDHPWKRSLRSLRPNASRSSP
jgi:hypothetical protein